MNSSFALRRALAAAIVLAAVVCMPAQAALKIDTSGVDLKSTAFKRFRDYVDAAANGSPGYGFSATDAATLYQLSPKEKYCTLAIRLVQTQVDDADARIAQGQRPAVAGDSYLEAGPMISDLGLTWEVCRTLISDAQRAQWSTYAEQTIHNIWNPKAAKWGERAFEWTGWSIDNPGNNYYYSFVEATMFWALASNNETWLKFLREKKLPALTAYFGKLVGGGSLEGTGYGAAHMRLFAIYRVWRDSTGEDLANANSHVDDSIRFWVHATMPTLDRFAPIGDQSRVSVPEIYDYHRRLVLEARALSKNEEVRDIASWWLHSISIPEMTSGFNLRHDLLPAGDRRPAAAIPPLRGQGNRACICPQRLESRCRLGRLQRRSVRGKPCAPGSRWLHLVRGRLVGGYREHLDPQRYPAGNRGAQRAALRAQWNHHPPTRAQHIEHEGHSLPTRKAANSRPLRI
jgi:hypothetical protein